MTVVDEGLATAGSLPDPDQVRAPFFLFPHVDIQIHLAMDLGEELVRLGLSPEFLLVVGARISGIHAADPYQLADCLYDLIPHAVDGLKNFVPLLGRCHGFPLSILVGVSKLVFSFCDKALHVPGKIFFCGSRERVRDKFRYSYLKATDLSARTLNSIRSQFLNTGQGPGSNSATPENARKRFPPG